MGDTEREGIVKDTHTYHYNSNTAPNYSFIGVYTEAVLENSEKNFYDRSNKNVKCPYFNPSMMRQ